MTAFTLDRACKLYTPGPVNIPNRVLSRSAFPSLHHRTQEFSAILGETLELLKPLFGTQQMVLPVHTTGRGALEGVYNNLLTAQDKVLTIANGSFGHMAATTLQCNGIPCVECFTSWEEPVDLSVLEELILRHRPTAITAVHSDTSNGVLNPIESIGQLARKYKLLFIVDTVSGLGCLPFELDAWGVDVAVTASQKGLMSPAGLSFVAMSPFAQEVSERTHPRDFYINLKDIRKCIAGKNETPGSTPVSLVLAVNEALHMIHEEGIQNVFTRHHNLSMATKAALTALGFSLFPKDVPSRSDALSVCVPPDGVSAADLVQSLRSDYRLMIGKGLGSYVDQLVRISNIGFCYAEDMLELIAAMEAVLKKMRYLQHMGSGVDAFVDSFANP